VEISRASSSGQVFRIGGALLLATWPLSGCGGAQSALNPKGPSAEALAGLWWAMLAVAAVVMLVVVAMVIMIVVGASRRDGERRLSRRGAWMMVLAGGVAAPVAAVFALVLSGAGASRAMLLPQPPDALTIEVEGRLWWWEIRYLGPDGATVATTANEVHIPTGERVRFRLISDNVIHSFWVPNLQGKTDLVPGQVNESWVTAAEAGTYRGQCAELCGVQHALMAFVVVAEPRDEFERWLQRQAADAPAPSGALAALGRDVFVTACGTCHAVRGTAAAGRQGPDLTHLASRRTLAAGTIPNTPGHLGGWIMDPQAIKPGSLMPASQLSPAELEAVMAYLGELR